MAALYKLKYKEGDVAFHKKYKNVLINTIIHRDEESSRYCGDVFKDNHEFFAYEIFYRGGADIVLEKDLMPINAATRKLYG